MASPTSEVIRLENVRLSYPKLFTPEAFEEGKPKKFQATFLLDPSDPKHAAKIKEIKRAAAKLMHEAYGPDFDRKAMKGYCFGNGDNKKKEDGSVREGYEGMFYLSASNEKRTAVANRNGAAVLEGQPETPYGGCFVNGTITLWAQNHPKGGKRINANLRGVQFVRDGEAFGAAPVSAEDEFEALEDNSPVDDAGDLDDFDDDIPF